MSNETFQGYSRVSDVLYPFSGLQNVPVELVENAGLRGTKVHNICEGIISGFGEVGVDEETWPYVESFKQWWKDGDGFQVIAQEERFFNDVEAITGQCDNIFLIDNALALVDYKTSYKASKTWQVQAEAYYWLAKDKYDIQSLNFVHLSRFGKPPKIHVYPLKFDLWLATLKTYKHFFHKERNAA